MTVSRLSLQAAQQVWLARVSATAQGLSSRCVSLEDAPGCLLSEEVIAPSDLPAGSVSAMDGYAFGSHSLTAAVSPFNLLCVGESMAGSPFHGSVVRGQCVQIATGADIPPGCDTVVVVERCHVEGNRVFPYVSSETDVLKDVLKTVATIDVSASILQDIPPPDKVRGANIRAQGEVIQKGSSILKAGQRLDFRHITLLAALGITVVDVQRPLGVALFSTGDELHTKTENPLHDSNRPMLNALLRAYGVDVHDQGALPDDQQAIAAAFDRVAGSVDLILTTGGVSMGPRDHLRHVLEAHDNVTLWKMAVRPGKSVLCGQWRETPLLGLPGNPLAALAMYSVLGVPALARLQGAAWRCPSTKARLMENITGKSGRVDLLLALHEWDNKGNLKVFPLSNQQSHRIDLLVHATCFILLESDRASAETNSLVSIGIFDDLLGYALNGTTAVFHWE